MILYVSDVTVDECIISKVYLIHSVCKRWFTTAIFQSDHYNVYVN
jgi:hypothetical protein